MKKILLILGIGFLSLTGCNHIDDNVEMLHPHNWEYVRTEWMGTTKDLIETTDGYTYLGSEKSFWYRDVYECSYCGETKYKDWYSENYIDL